MKLFVQDRLMILAALPKEGNLLTLRMIRDLQASIGFSSTEHERLGLKTNGNTVTWDKANDGGIDLGFDSAQMGLILDRFKELDKQGKLTMDQLPTYETLLDAKV